MAKERYEYCATVKIRRAMEEQLGLPAYGGHETATAFWSRVERAGLLVKALARYDDKAAEYAEWRQTQVRQRRSLTSVWKLPCASEVIMD